jgi:predicted RNA-binding protein with PIN domain
MTYLIDGHNLIPQVPGLSLDRLDDEEELLSRLEAFSQLKKCQIEVFFDRGQIGHERNIHRNRVNAHFVLSPMTADDAISARLLGIGRAARNYIVVSSDHSVQNRARQHGASILSSREFAAMLEQVHLERKDKTDETKTNPGEIDEWLDLFTKGRPKEKL